MPLPLLDIFGFFWLFEPLLYLLLPNLQGRLDHTGRIIQKIGLLFFSVSLITAILAFTLGSSFILLFILSFGISYMLGFACLLMDSERKK